MANATHSMSVATPNSGLGAATSTSPRPVLSLRRKRPAHHATHSPPGCRPVSDKRGSKASPGCVVYIKSAQVRRA